jgi:ERF superfamily
MQRSSPNIGTLAAALAKAQSEIVNPEKSLTATIVSPFPREGSRTFRYAPLSTGLDLVRKCLGQHEIATVQTTAIDGDSGLIRLTTTLVHASGEWVASDWPVCPVSETAAPHRLGAALTYARRYALFTLVGIAGEDDLDAPDLSPAVVPPASQNGPPRPNQGPTGLLHHPAPSQAASPPLQNSDRRAHAGRAKPASLLPEASDKLRLQLLSDLEELKEADALATWAHRVLPLKNQLTTGDAQSLETAFAAKLSQLGDAPLAERVESPVANGRDEGWSEPGRTDRVLTIGKPVHERDRNHLRFVASQPCVVCGRGPSDAHHLRFAEQRAMGRKVSDKFTVPVCRLHHRELHRRGDERAWWDKQGIDPLPIATALWAKTHAVDSFAAELAGDLDRPTKLNGEHLANKFSAAVQHQNNETKPILGSEAG